MNIDKHHDPFGHLEQKLLQELKFISRDLGGTFTQLYCSDHSGAKWKKIVIEYDREGS